MSDIQQHGWDSLPTRLQVSPHEGFAPAVAPRSPYRLFDPEGAPRTIRLAVPPEWATSQPLPCHGRAEAWFAMKRGANAKGHAAQLCRGCPVIEKCLDFALEQEAGVAAQHRYGVFGGTTPTMRYQLSKERDMLTTVDEDGESA